MGAQDRHRDEGVEVGALDELRGLGVHCLRALAS
jgi:hypothetical protein